MCVALMVVRASSSSNPVSTRIAQRCTVKIANLIGDDAKYAEPVPVLRVFAAAREAVGSSTVIVAGETVAQVLDNAIVQFGEKFADVLAQSKVWVNGEEVPRSRAVSDNDEVAVLPPVSGGV